MKQGRALSEVLTELQRQNAAKQDFIGPAQAFTLRPDGSTFEIVHTNSGRQEVFGTTDLFHRQIGSTLGIPAKYYDQMRKLKPELLAENVNAWFADREQSYMIRSMDYGNGRMAACEYGLNTDFEKLVNPTGRFVIGGPFADCGVTGRKLACDTYGGIGHIGGGAMSGKDPSKVDRSGAYMARKIARDIVLAGYAEKCEVQIAYAIGVAEPVSVYVETFGTEYQDKRFIEQYVRDSYDLTPKGIIDSLGLLDVDYNRVSAYGHFGKADLPWEK